MRLLKKSGYIIILIVFYICIENFLLFIVKDITDTGDIILIHSKTNFPIEKIMQAEKVKDYSFTFESYDIQSVSAINKNELIVVSATNPAIEEIERINVVQGRFFNNEEFINAENVCVIDVNTSWKLIGTGEITGLYLELYGETFKIVGVCEKPDGYVYIPLTTALVKKENQIINNIFLKSEHKGSYEFEEAEKFIKNMVIDLQKTEFFNLGSYVNLLLIKSRFAFLIISIISILYFFKAIANYYLKGHSLICHSLKEDYFIEAFIKNKVELIRIILKINILVLAIITVIIINLKTFTRFHLSAFPDIKNPVLLFDELCVYTGNFIKLNNIICILNIVLIFITVIIKLKLNEIIINEKS